MFAQGLTAALWPHFPASPEAQAEFGPVQCVRSADTSTGSSDPASAIKSKKKRQAIASRCSASRHLMVSVCVNVAWFLQSRDLDPPMGKSTLEEEKWQYWGERGGDWSCSGAGFVSAAESIFDDPLTRCPWSVR